jgi:hypothetical protein
MAEVAPVTALTLLQPTARANYAAAAKAARGTPDAGEGMARAAFINGPDRLHFESCGSAPPKPEHDP